MSVFNRCLKYLKRSTDVFLAPAEDPRQAFPAPHKRQDDLLKQVERTLATTRVFEQQLAERKAGLEERIPQWTRKARQALQAGREDLARVALHRQHAFVCEVQAIDRQREETQREAERLSLIRQQLETDIQTILARQKVLTARFSAAEAQVRLHESLSGVSESLSDMGLSLEKAEQQAAYMQARAAAVNDLLETGVLDAPALAGTDSVSRQLDRLDNAQVVEARLEALKREVGGGGR